MKRFAAVLGLLAMFACGGGGSDSGGSNPSSTPLAAPVITSAVPGDNSATIGWSAVTGANGYNLYYSNQSPVTKSSSKSTGVVSPCTISNLAAGQRYYFAVSASNSAGESNLSNEAVVDVPTPAPVKFQFSGVSEPLLVTADSVYVGIARNGDAFIVKYDKATGQQIWEVPALTTVHPDKVTGLAVIGNLVLAFGLEDDYIIPGMGGGKIWFLKFAADTGVKLFEISVIGRGVVYGPVTLENFIYIATDSWIGKVDIDGNMIAQATPNVGLINTYVGFYTLVADSTGVYFAGRAISYSTGGQDRFAVAKYDGNLNRLWYYQRGDFSDPSADILGNGALAVSPFNGAVYIAGLRNLFGTGSVYGETVKLDINTGAPLQINSTTAPAYNLFLLSGGTEVFRADLDSGVSNISSINTDSLNTVWNLSFNGWIIDWAWDNNLIYVSDGVQNYIRVFDPATRAWMN